MTRQNSLLSDPKQEDSAKRITDIRVLSYVDMQIYHFIYGDWTPPPANQEDWLGSPSVTVGQLILKEESELGGAPREDSKG